MYNNQDYQQQPEQHKSVYTSSLELLAIIIAFLMSALFGTYAAYFTLPLILSIALPVFGSGDEDFIKGAWLLISHLLIFFGVLFFAHLKLTVFGTKVVMKPFKEEPLPQKQRGGFLKVIGFIALMFALFSLTGCNEEQTRKETIMQEQQHEHLERIKDKELSRDVTIARERGSFELAKQKEDHIYYGKSQDSRQKHAFDLQQALYTAEQLARAAWHDLINGTAAPLLKSLALIIAVLIGGIYAIKRICAMLEKLAEEARKRAIALALLQHMPEVERKRAFKNMVRLNDTDVIDVQVIRGA